MFRQHCCLLPLALLAVAVGWSLAPLAAQEYGTPIQVGTFFDSRLTEVSGMVPVTGRPGLFWVHNDSDNPNDIFVVRESGTLLAVVEVVGASNRDWEDIATGPGPIPGRSYLYIADTGNNTTDRTNLGVYRIPEPILPETLTGQQFSSARAEHFRLRYPDGNFNAEAMVVHPQTGTIYIITKTTGTAGAYRLRNPVDNGVQRTLERIGSFIAPGEITAADLSSDARHLLVRSFPAVQDYRIGEGVPFEQIFSAPRRTLPNANIREPKSEAICFDLQDLHFYTCNEITPASIHVTPSVMPHEFCEVPDDLADAVRFRRGDVFGGDARLDARDLRELQSIVETGSSLFCPDAGDVQDDGAVDALDVEELADSIVENYRLPPPSGSPSLDPTYDDLGCGFEFGDLLVPEDWLWRYWSSTLPPREGWRDPGTDLSDWPQGPGGIGFGSEHLGTVITDSVSTRVGFAARCEFDVPRAEDIEMLILRIDYDDGFVAYLNGVEVGRRGLGSAGFELLPTQTASIHTGRGFEDIVICSAPIVSGRNVLALEIRNRRSLGSQRFFRAVLRSATSLEEPPVDEIELVGEASLSLLFPAPVYAGEQGALELRCNTDTPIASGMVQLDFDTRHLAPRQVRRGSAAEAFDLFEWNINTATGALSGVFCSVISSSGPADLPAGDGLVLASIAYGVVVEAEASSTIRFTSRSGSIPLRSQLFDTNGDRIVVSTSSRTVSISVRVGPVLQSFLNNEGPPGQEFLVIGRGLDSEIITARVCGRGATVENLNVNTLRIVAPSCTTEGWVEVEICTEIGCHAVEEGFFYTESSPVWARGDANNDLRVDVSDAVAMLGELFLGRIINPACRVALDANSDSRFDVSDPVYILNFLFGRVDGLRPPFPGDPELCPAH